MSEREPIRVRHFEDLRALDFLGPEDRHLFKKPNPEFKFAVIGTGTIGQEHMYVTELEGRASIHGIYDAAPRSIEVAQQGFARYSERPLKLYGSIDELCADPALDAVLICTPNHTHLEVLRAVMTSGKAILLEKPMATTVADAAEIVRLARDYPAPVQIGLQYRFKSTYVEAAHEALERRSCGDIKSVGISEYRPPFLDKVGQWNKFAALSGGTLIEKCCHYFDLMALFAGARPVRVIASGSQAVNFTEFEKDDQRADMQDNADVLIEFANGVRGSFSLNMFAPLFREEMVLAGDKALLTTSEVFDPAAGQRASFDLSLAAHEPGISKRTQPRYPHFIESSGHAGATYMEHRAFVDRLRGEKTAAATLLDGLWSVITGAAAQTSCETGEPVDIEAFVAETDGLSALLSNAE